jgi:hypothetical protein
MLRQAKRDNAVGVDGAHSAYISGKQAAEVRKTPFFGASLS